ncbi:MAG: HEAT repeat domain-containing protein [Pirellulales bacterium]
MSDPIMCAPPARSPHRPVTTVYAALCGLGVVLAVIGVTSNDVTAQPVCLDDRIVIELFAEHPAIVTPTGIAVDPAGRVLVIENNTHFRPATYEGPTTDRILAFAPADAAGSGGAPTVFFSGTQSTMNLAVHPNGWTYVATRGEILRVRDSDGDGRADQRETLVRHVTKGDYPHNGLSGFAFDFAGDVYFGQGENLGEAYELVGADGTTLGGGGEGGNVYRCDAQGNRLTRLATGFWNPFHLAIDAYGRLFAVDNDPDARPPCRLVHVVAGGDYGYRFRNGRRGLHPFTAWNGELPGTLPMVAGTGEAPSAVVCYESDGLPNDFRGSILVTSWGDHRIERFDLTRHGATFRSVARPLIQGDEDFRPVGMVQAPDGSLYVSDWVDKSYELHGKGRIWRIRAAGNPRPVRPPESGTAAGQSELTTVDRPRREAFARNLAQDRSGREMLEHTLASSRDPAVRLTCWRALVGASADGVLDADRFDPRPGYAVEQSADVRSAMVASAPVDLVSLAAVCRDEFSPLVQAAVLRRTDVVDARERTLLIDFLADADPFLRQAAREALDRVATSDELLRLSADEQADTRLAAVLLLRRRDEQDARETIPRLLVDADSRVRFCAIQWIGESQLEAFREPLRQSLAAPGTTPQLFGALLAALRMLDHGIVTPASEEVSPTEYVAAVLTAGDTPDTLRARALRLLPPTYPGLTLPQLTAWLASDNPQLALEAVRTLRERTEPAARSALLELAANTRAAALNRAEAVVGLSPTKEDERRLLLSLAAR